MIRKVLSVALLFTAVGCSKGGSGEVKELSNGYCRTFFREVGEASAKYDQFAAAIAAGNLDAEQRKRAEADLPYGASRQERGLMSMELLKRMSFCATIRNGGFEKMDAAYSTMFQDFREKDDPAVSARSMSQMTSFAQELGKLPLKN